MKNYNVSFDEVILNQFKKSIKNREVREILSKMFDKIEEKGPKAGKLLDPKLKLYEMKNKRPPIRMYFEYDKSTGEITIFEFHMKKSDNEQKGIISKLKDKLSKS